MAHAANINSLRRRPKRPRRKRPLTLCETKSANEVWAAYSNVKTAQRQRQAAEALVASANQSYAAARESYQYGVRNLLDVVSAQKALAQASSEDIYTRTQLLIQLANLAFRTGDLIQTPAAKTTPGP